MSVPALLLTDLPAELKEKIANVLDYNSKMSLRQVTKDFKEAVDNSEFFYDSLIFKWDSESKKITISLQVDSDIQKELEFHDASNGFIVKNEAEKWEKAVDITDVNYIDAAMEHFWKILKHRNRSMIHLNELGMHLKENCFEDERSQTHLRQINEKLKSDSLNNKTKLSVKSLDLRWSTHSETYLDVISSVRPGVLEKLSVLPRLPRKRSSDPDIGPDFDFTRIAETDQWKQLKWLEAWLCVIQPADLDTSHLATFRWQKSKVTLEEVKDFVDQFFLNPTWQNRQIGLCSFDQGAFANHFFEPGKAVTGIDETVIRRGQDACRFELGFCTVLIERL